MRYVNLLTIVVFLFGLVQRNGAQSCYELVWSDEFNYSGLPDASKWSYEVGSHGWGNNELQYYTDKRSENARVEDSVLVIEARKEAFLGSQYTSARLITYNNNLSWQYGKIEARIKLPYGQGIWPAFWMLGNGIFEGTNWPACGEIDIMEMIGGGEGRDDKTYGTLHWSNGIGEHASSGGSTQLATGIFYDQFHVFSVEWDQSFISWYLDGKQYYVVNITPADLSEFHKEFFILLNVAVGGSWPGNPNASTQFPQKMLVDYVRVYQKNTAPSIIGKKKVVKAEVGIPFSVLGSDEFSYIWSVPDDAEIVSGQGTSSITVNWGCVEGLVKCELTTLCQTYSIEYPVALDPLVISGDLKVAGNELNIPFSVPETKNALYSWTLPSGVSSSFKLDTSSVFLNWGTTDGTLKINVTNVCGVDSAKISVAAINQLPYPNANEPHQIPGTIESVHYDTGGEGIAYHDLEAANNGPGIRQNEGVDTEYSLGAGNVGWTEDGEWLEYTIQPIADGLYDIEINLASIYNTGKFKILINGEDKAGVINVPNTNAWNTFKPLTIKNVSIAKTNNLLRLEVVSGSFNFGKLTFSSVFPNALHDHYALEFSIYPTVVNGYLHVKGLNTNALYSICDLSGKMLSEGEIEPGDVISVSHLKSGTYLLSISNNAIHSTQRFIKNR